MLREVIAVSQREIPASFQGPIRHGVTLSSRAMATALVRLWSWITEKGKPRFMLEVVLPELNDPPHGWSQLAWFDDEDSARKAYHRINDHVSRLGVLIPSDYRHRPGWEYW